MTRHSWHVSQVYYISRFKLSDAKTDIFIHVVNGFLIRFRCIVEDCCFDWVTLRGWSLHCLHLQRFCHHRELFPSVNALNLLADLRSPLCFSRLFTLHRFSFSASDVPITAVPSSSRDSSHQALPWNPTGINLALRETLHSSRAFDFCFDVMDLHDQVDFDTRSYSIRTCDFTLMKFLLESTFAASVIFGHACHAKTVVVPCKIADSPLDHTKTACVVVPGCSVVAAWRTIGSCAVFPTDAVHTAFPSPRRWCWVDPPQNPASHPHHPQAPRISKSSPPATFVQCSLDTGRIQHVYHDFGVSWIMFHHHGMAHRSSSARTARCDNIVISFRSDSSASSLTKSESLQVVALGKNHEIVSVTRQRDVSYPLVLHKLELSFFDFDITIVIKFAAVCSIPYMLLNKSQHMSGFSHWQQETDRRLYMLNSLFFVILLLTSIDACLNEDVASSTFSRSIPAWNWRIVNSVCTNHDGIWTRCLSRLLMWQISFRLESRTYLANTDWQKLGSSLATCI